MAAAVDASSPVRVNASPSSPAGKVTTASFTAPANALIIACLCADGATGAGHQATCADTGGLTWTEAVRRDWSETTGGGCAIIWTAPQVTSAARTVSITHSAGPGTQLFSLKVYVLTGVDLAGTPLDTVGANNEGGSTTNNFTTTSLTPGATGLLVCCDTDWSAAGVFTSTDLTIDTAQYAGFISACSGYKTCTSGVGVTGNLDAFGSGATQHKWCQIIVRETAATVATLTVSDGPTLGETVARMLLTFPSVSDGITLGDPVAEQLLAFPQIVTEGLTVGETLVTTVPFLALLSTEALTVTDPDTVSLSLIVDVTGLIGSLALAGVGV